jgi:L-fuculose-phosphate aldolase
MANLQSQRRAMVHFGKLLHERGYVAATDGNLSVRLDEQSILVTPTGVSKGMMRPQDLLVVDCTGRKLSGARNVSSEIALHLLIYSLRNDVNAIVHAHPVVATGYAAAGITLDTALVSEAFIGLRALPLARYATPGTPELSEAVRSFVCDHEAILMANHGVITYAEDLQHAYMRLELVEHFAMISLVTRLLGQQHPLAPQDLEKLATLCRPKPGFSPYY